MALLTRPELAELRGPSYAVSGALAVWCGLSRLAPPLPRAACIAGRRFFPGGGEHSCRGDGRLLFLRLLHIALNLLQNFVQSKLAPRESD